MTSIAQIVSTLAALVMGLQGLVANPSSQLAQASVPKIGQVLGASTPELPRAYVDTSMPATSNTCTINVASGGDFQAAIDSAKLGDTICLQAGATFTGPFYLPKKTTGSGWLTIRTSNLDNNFVAPGTRVSPSEASKMPRLVSRGYNDPVLLTKNGANNYRLIGLEVTKAPDTYVSELIVLGDWWEAVLKRGVDSRPEFQPYNIVLDRMYIHGDMVSDTKRGVRMHCNNCAVIDSHISQIQSPYQDTQAISGWNSEGPFKIVNNYLEATGENVMFGGADPGIDFTPTVSPGATVSFATLSSVDGLKVGKSIMFTVGGKTGEKSWTTVRSINGNNITFDPIVSAPDANSPAYHGVIPSDFEIRKNYFFKPRYWNPKDPSFAGKGYFVKNLFETKAMQRVLLDSNIFENSWSSAQSGGGILIKSHNQDGGCPYCITQDLTITNNLVLNTNDPITIVGTESYSDWNKVPALTKRVKIENNLFYNESSWPNTVVRSILIYNEPMDIVINHNTIFGIYNLLFTNYEDNPKNKNFVLTNNIIQRGAYGIGNVSEGKGYLDAYFPGYAYAKNVLINSSNTFNDTIRTDEYFKNSYPEGTLVSSFSGVGFVDAANGNFKLSNSSPFKNAGTDGKDIGADIDVINNAVAGVKTSASQLPPPPPASPTPPTPPVSTDKTPPKITSLNSKDVSWVSAIIDWKTDEMATGKIEYGTTDSLGSSVSPDSNTRNSHQIEIDDLLPGTTYYYRVRSADSLGNESVSEIKNFKTKNRLSKPPKPQTLNARKGSVILEWSAVDYDLCTNIKIYRSTSDYVSTPNESNRVATLDCAATSFRDVNVSPNTYYYSLFVVDDVGVYSDPLFVQFVIEPESTPAPQVPASSSGGGGGGGGGSTSSSSGRRNVPYSSGGGSVTPTFTACVPPGAVLNRNLAFRSEGEDVKTLQNFLVQKGYTTPDNITGFFGPVTMEAVKKFQRDNSIVSSGNYLTTGYGMVGPVTRIRINSMNSGSCATQTGSNQSKEALQEQINILYKQVQELILKLNQVR